MSLHRHQPVATISAASQDAAILYAYMDRQQQRRHPALSIARSGCRLCAVLPQAACPPSRVIASNAVPESSRQAPLAHSGCPSALTSLPTFCRFCCNEHCSEEASPLPFCHSSSVVDRPTLPGTMALQPKMSDTRRHCFHRSDASICPLPLAPLLRAHYSIYSHCSLLSQ